MRITCFITVCVYLSSTVSTNEIKYLNRIKKTRLHEDLVVKDFTVKKEISPIPEIYPDVYSTLPKSWTKVQIETFQKPRRTRGLMLEPQHHYYNHGRPRRFLKRLKTRSINGAPYELNSNHLNELTKPEVHEGPIHIEPVLRVTTKKNVFDSIVDILGQLLNPSKNEPGPLVGPINVPGSARKIYLRLMEPVKSSHVMVRFVTQVPVPVIDVEPKHGPIIPIPPIIDPAAVLLKGQHTALSDAVFSTTRHLPRNVSHTSGKVRGPQLNKPPALNLNSPSKDVESGAGASSKDGFLPGKGKENKNPFAELNLEDHQNSFLSESNSYYPYQAGGDVGSQVKQLLNDSTTVVENGGSKDPPGTWYELSTHRLPLRQIAPLYPSTSVEHTESSSSSSYEDTYKVPSDVLTGPSSYISPYAQFNSASGSVVSSYEPHYSASSSYSVSYNKPNDVHTTPSSYSSSYQKKNEFNDDSNFRPTPYWNQEEFNKGPNTYSTSYGKPNDLYSESSSYSMSYARPTNTSSSPSSSVSSSHEKQNGSQITSNFNDALRVIDPPSFFPTYQKSSESYVNRSSPIEPSTIRQSRYSLRNEVGTNSRQRDYPVIWGEMKREKNESKGRKVWQNGDSSETNDAHNSWQPVVYQRENTDWHEADLTKLVNNRQEDKQSFEPLKKTSRNVTLSSLKRADPVDRHQSTASSRRRGTPVPVTRTRKCLVSSKEVGCEQAKLSLTPDLKITTKVVEKQTQPTVETEPVVAVVSEAKRGGTVENMRLLDVTTKSPTTTSSLTEKPLPLVVTTKNPTASSTTEILLPLIRTTKSPETSSTTERFIVDVKTRRTTANNGQLAVKPTMKPASGTTEKPSTTESTKESLPKRLMVMKKPTFIMKRMELNSITKKEVASSTTQRPTMSSAMKKTMTTRKSTFRGGISRTKSSII